MTTDLPFDLDPEFDDGLEEAPVDPLAGIIAASLEEVSPETHVAIIHDSFGEKHVNVVALAERGGAVTILRVLGVLKLEPRGNVQYFLDSAKVDQEHPLTAGQEVYIVGKLAGGR